MSMQCRFRASMEHGTYRIIKEVGQKGIRINDDGECGDIGLWHLLSPFVSVPLYRRLQCVDEHERQFVIEGHSIVCGHRQRRIAGFCVHVLWRVDDLSDGNLAVAWRFDENKTVPDPSHMQIYREELSEDKHHKILRKVDYERDWRGQVVRKFWDEQQDGGGGGDEGNGNTQRPQSAVRTPMMDRVSAMIQWIVTNNTIQARLAAIFFLFMTAYALHFGERRRPSFLREITE